MELLEGEDRQAKSHFFRLLTDLNDYKALITIFSGKDVVVDESSTSVLGQIDPLAKQAVPALIELLNDPNEYVRRNATSALGEIGLEAKQAVPALILALNNEKEWV